MYDSPGLVDDLSNDLLIKWNDVIKVNYDNRISDGYGSRFFKLDPNDIHDPVSAPILWFADPAEPNFCRGPEVAQQLSDWGIKGRQALHNEYAEYSIITKPDSSGKLRPKRVQITTELREYWVCLAMYDPQKLLSAIESIIGFKPSWNDLYGVGDPFSLSEKQREKQFSKLVAGSGKDEGTRGDQPVGKINTDNALFMTHPINGLDDLLYVVMFGSRPYAVSENGSFREATREQIFRQNHVEYLACRHADPAAAMGAYSAVFHGRDVAFENPLGMYIQSFNSSTFTFQNEPIPKEWIKFSRGQPETITQKQTWQRLEFGPSDNEPYFLDEIRVSIGGLDKPLLGGFQILEQIEVGPLIWIGEQTQIPSDEYVIITSKHEAIPCSEAGICSTIEELKKEYDKQPLGRIGPRLMGRVSL
jgi:hypothetical protein